MSSAIPGLVFIPPEDSGFFPATTVEPQWDDPSPDADNFDRNMPPADPSALVCEVCGIDLVYSGRGRKPKRCPDHKGKRASSDDGTPRPRRASQIEKLHEDLLSGAAQASLAMMPFVPVSAVTLTLRAENGLGAMIRVAQDLEARGHPGFMNGLVLASQITPWMEIGSFGGALIYAAGVDAGRFSPEGFIAENLGVAEAARQVGYGMREPEPPEYVPTTYDGALSPPPPRFAINIPER